MGAHQLPLDTDRALRNGFFTLKDPGDGNTISPSRGMGLIIVEVETAGAETRVLPDADSLPVGTRIIVILKKDGGDLTITTADTPDTVLKNAGQAVEFLVARKDVGGTISQEFRRTSVVSDGAALTASHAALTNSTTGITDDTLAAMPGNSTTTDISGEVNNNFAELHELTDNLRTRVLELESRLQDAGLIA